MNYLHLNVITTDSGKKPVMVVTMLVMIPELPEEKDEKESTSNIR
jgi:hypothetical protein